MNAFTPLWKTIVGSSLWDEPDHVRLVFVTMLACQDYDHIYRGTAYKLSKEARVPEIQVLEALKILAFEDTRRVERQDYEGRRIRSVEDGWLILNGEKYQAMMQEELRRARLRKAQRKWREKKKKSNPLPGAKHTKKLHL